MGMETVPVARGQIRAGNRPGRRVNAKAPCGVAAILRLPLAAAFLSTQVFAESHVTGDAEAGKEAFARQCVTCHMVIDATGEKLAGVRGRTGPNLYGVNGNVMGSVDGFRYGPSMVAANDAGLVWTEENFVSYVMDPTGWLRTALDDPGARSRMSFKVRKEGDAADIYAFLAALGPTESAAAPVEEPAEEAVEAKPPRVLIPVTFSDEQSSRGEKRYKKDCQECHGDNLKGGLNGGAPLRGRAFEEKYLRGAPASAMFALMSTSMPPNSPGRYSATTYSELMAYILDKNGFRPSAPLPSELDALDGMLIEK